MANINPFSFLGGMFFSDPAEEEFCGAGQQKSAADPENDKFEIIPESVRNFACRFLSPKAAQKQAADSGESAADRMRRMQQAAAEERMRRMQAAAAERMRQMQQAATEERMRRMQEAAAAAIAAAQAAAAGPLPEIRDLSLTNSQKNKFQDFYDDLAELGRRLNRVAEISTIEDRLHKVDRLVAKFDEFKADLGDAAADNNVQRRIADFEEDVAVVRRALHTRSFELRIGDLPHTDRALSRMSLADFAARANDCDTLMTEIEAARSENRLSAVQFSYVKLLFNIARVRILAAWATKALQDALSCEDPDGYAAKRDYANGVISRAREYQQELRRTYETLQSVWSEEDLTLPELPNFVIPAEDAVPAACQHCPQTPVPPEAPPPAPTVAPNGLRIPPWFETPAPAPVPPAPAPASAPQEDPRIGQWRAEYQRLREANSQRLVNAMDDRLVAIQHLMEVVSLMDQIGAVQSAQNIKSDADELKDRLVSRISRLYGQEMDDVAGMDLPMALQKLSGVNAEIAALGNSQAVAELKTKALDLQRALTERITQTLQSQTDSVSTLNRQTATQTLKALNDNLSVLSAIQGVGVQAQNLQRLLADRLYQLFSEEIRNAPSTTQVAAGMSQMTEQQLTALAAQATTTLQTLNSLKDDITNSPLEAGRINNELLPALQRIISDWTVFSRQIQEQRQLIVDQARIRELIAAIEPAVAAFRQQAQEAQEAATHFAPSYQCSEEGFANQLAVETVWLAAKSEAERAWSAAQQAVLDAQAEYDRLNNNPASRRIVYGITRPEMPQDVRNPNYGQNTPSPETPMQRSLVQETPNYIVRYTRDCSPWISRQTSNSNMQEKIKDAVEIALRGRTTRLQNGQGITLVEADFSITTFEDGHIGSITVTDVQHNGEIDDELPQSRQQAQLLEWALDAYREAVDDIWSSVRARSGVLITFRLRADRGAIRISNFSVR